MISYSHYHKHLNSKNVNLISMSCIMILIFTIIINIFHSFSTSSIAKFLCLISLYVMLYYTKTTFIVFRRKNVECRLF